MQRVAAEPKPKFIYSGIKEGSVGIVFGPSKSGKTMYCENLLQSMVSGQSSYLGMPINVKADKVLMLSFEEYYTHRTERNGNQVGKLIPIHGKDWIDNFQVIDERMPTYISTPEDWQLLAEVITESGASVVVIDSITRMCEGIEDSATAQTFMRKLKNLALKTKATLIAVHHTTKMYGMALSIDNIAGSRVVAQEIDFAIGINRTIDGKRYIKEVAFRYAQSESETVKTFTIDANCWLNITGEVNENKLLQGNDGRRNESNGDKIICYLESKVESDREDVATSELETHLVPQFMSRGTMFNQLRKLKQEGRIIEADGKYKVAA